jgi:glycosyltransferase involved in cell wall biosynthesis
MMDVLVTCFDHGSSMRYFPQVRGHYLAHHLRRSGINAEFRQLPAPSVECKVLICSEFQAEMSWFEKYLAGPLGDIRADRMFCMIDASLFDRPNHFSSDYCQWFRQRGGLLVHRENPRFLDGEHWIGLGVDADVVRPAADGRRDRVLFDFPANHHGNTADEFDVELLEALRKCLPDQIFVGTGTPDARIRNSFDEWVPHGQDHRSYVARLFSGTLAVIPGRDESMGLTMAEAQVAGACIVQAGCGPPRDMITPEASIICERDPDSIAAALIEARSRDGQDVRRAGMAKFDFAAVAARTRTAIGL